MPTKKNLMVLAIMTLCLPAMAAPIFLDFENVPTDPSRVGKAYEDSLGVSFSDNAWSSVSVFNNENAKNPGSFFRAVGNRFTRGALTLSANPLNPPVGGPIDGSFFINVEQGFKDSFSMLYTAATNARNNGVVRVYSEINGGGDSLSVNSGLGTTATSPLASAPLQAQSVCIDPDTGKAAPDFYCTWARLELGFAGTARSIEVSGDFTKYFFDDLQLGATGGGGGTVPEPSGVALSLAALGALAWTRQRAVKR